MLVSVSHLEENVSEKWKNGNVEALTKQNGVRLLGKLKKKFKKMLKPTYPT
jgi:hypothetical protein